MTCDRKKEEAFYAHISTLRYVLTHTQKAVHHSEVVSIFSIIGMAFFITRPFVFLIRILMLIGSITIVSAFQELNCTKNLSFAPFLFYVLQNLLKLTDHQCQRLVRLEIKLAFPQAT